MIINLNGKIVSPDKATISIFDHGFLYGDSIYEVIRTSNSRLFTAQEHLERLRQSANAIYLEVPLSDEELMNEMNRTHTASGNEESYIRIVVTRGVGEIDLHPQSCLVPNWMFIVKPLTVWPKKSYTEGIKVSLVGIRRNPENALSPRIKSGNYLNNVIAMIQARKVEAAEGIMLNQEGFVTEGTTSNIWIVKNGIAITPTLESGLLRGITRSLLFEFGKTASIPIRENQIRVDELLNAEEVFITSTTRGIMPVRQIDDTMIGHEMPGPITYRLMMMLDERLKAN